jgi:hypothetical protein
VATVSNPATMSSVYSTFSAPANTHLSAFLRGGSYVPNISANSNVPTALPIKLSQLAGATNYVNVGASVSPTSVSGAGLSPLTTASCTATGSGGNASYTYTWAYVSGNTANITLNSGQGTATANWKVTGVNGNNWSAVWKCTISDGTTSASANVTVSGTIT